MPNLTGQRTLKIAFDRTAAAFLLIVLSPLVVLISLAILITMGRPVFFRQPRIGLSGRRFTIVKFRTMTFAKGPDGQLLPDSQRLRRVGKILRAASLDELPELLNVLQGDMSLVGPRPLLVQYLTRYNSFQSRRHEVLPGITGWAQINGRNAVTWERKFELDVWYVDHWTLTLDLRILALTLWKVLKHEGINQPGSATAEEFQGTPPSG